MKRFQASFPVSIHALSGFIQLFGLSWEELNETVRNVPSPTREGCLTAEMLKNTEIMFYIRGKSYGVNKMFLNKCMLRWKGVFHLVKTSLDGPQPPSPPSRSCRLVWASSPLKRAHFREEEEGAAGETVCGGADIETPGLWHAGWHVHTWTEGSAFF